MSHDIDRRLKAAQEYFDQLKIIAAYLPSEKLLRHADTLYGLSGYEAIEMAYDNVIDTAKSAIKGRRRPT